ncbi:RNA-directed DNA polymerase, eukaryota, reverse transcriptase zinc-binding domain protein [Tanacetum coccineum]|uniref:RNA-directed DNA polymerase, eukaryota, reverse transcriptase zinc-binding domain protein n=1 Tax=Tanacetum coccineum TaxID=301880 RepID=A0ABQ5ERU2_9ASTR
MAVSNLAENEYTKEIIRIKYEWKPPHSSTCLIYGHSLVDCPKAAPKRVVNNMDKGKGQTSGADDEGFIEVKKKKSCGNNGGTKNFKPVSVKPKTQQRPKAKQLIEGMSNSPKKTPFIALNVDNPINEEVAMGSKATTSGTQEEGQSSTHIVEQINVLKKDILEGKLVLVDYDGKPLENVDYPDNLNSVDEVEPEKQSSLVDTSILNFENTDLRSYPPSPTQGSTPTGNTPGMSSYANVTGVPNRKALNFHTLYTSGGNGVDVVMPIESIRAISKSSIDSLNAMLENGPWFIRNHSLILKKWNPNVNLLKEDVGNVPVGVKLHGVLVMGRSSYVRSMIELQADMELKDTIVVAMPKLTGEGFCTCTKECPKNPGLGVAKNLKKPSQVSIGVPVGLKVGFKPTKEYILVSKKPTTNTISSKKKGVEPTKEVSNSNLFNVLNSVENDRELGTNGGTSYLASNRANSSGNSSWNVETGSTSTTPIVDKIGKLEKLIIKRKINLVDDDGKPLKKVDYLGDHDSEDEVDPVDNDMAHSMASERVGFGTKSLLEQWRDTYESGDCDEDPYDDNMCEGQDLPDKIKYICENLDIRVRGRRKK